jgi:hypothetical protein
MTDKLEVPVLYLRRSEIGGPVELCVGSGSGEVDVIYVLRVSQLAKLVQEGFRLLFAHHLVDSMWGERFDERMRGSYGDKL